MNFLHSKKIQCIQHFHEIFVKPKSTYTTVWKFHDFSITQILREIDFLDGKSAKFAILFTTFSGS